jgi:hypothetical protein
MDKDEDAVSAIGEWIVIGLIYPDDAKGRHDEPVNLLA